MAQAGSGPELARAFAAALPLPTGRFHRAAANGPAPAGQRPVVHPAGVAGKVVLFAAHHFARGTFAARQGRDLRQHGLVLPVSQLMAHAFHPRLSSRRVLGVERFAQGSQMLAGVVKVQQLVGVTPTVVDHVPYPRRAIAHGQLGFWRGPTRRAGLPSAGGGPVPGPRPASSRPLSPPVARALCAPPARAGRRRPAWIRAIPRGAGQSCACPSPVLGSALETRPPSPRPAASGRARELSAAAAP